MSDISDRLKIKRPSSLVQDRELKLDELTIAEFFRKILGERAYQDEKWGGPDFDDTHSQQEWERHIAEYAAGTSERASKHDFKTRMIKVAALAAAAYQSQSRIDRHAD